MSKFDWFDSFLYYNGRVEKLKAWLSRLNSLAVQHCADLDLFVGVGMIAAFDLGTTPEDYLIQILWEV